jgi:hypothetical protein
LWAYEVYLTFSVEWTPPPVGLIGSIEGMIEGWIEPHSD